MAAWIEVLFSLGVLTSRGILATTLGDSASITELGLSLSTITDLPQIKLYSNNPIDFDPTTNTDVKSFHLRDRIHDSHIQNGDTIEVTVLPTSTYVWKKVKKANEGNRTADEDYAVGMPVAAALKTSGNGETRSDGTYIVNDDDGYACVMAYFKCQATIYFADSKGDFQSKVIAPEEGADIYGSCDRTGEVSEVSVKWSIFVLTLRFGLDDLTDSWFVSQFSLSYNLGDPMFTDSAPGSSSVTVVSKEGRKFWQTNNAYSFRCLLLHDIAMKDVNNNTATLHFDEVRVQAFCDERYFRRPKHCIHRVHRDEMVPVTVGATLAGSTLLTVFVYGIFRYFKIKKVQYDTMA